MCSLWHRKSSGTRHQLGLHQQRSKNITEMVQGQIERWGREEPCSLTWTSWLSLASNNKASKSPSHLGSLPIFPGSLFWQNWPKIVFKTLLSEVVLYWSKYPIIKQQYQRNPSEFVLMIPQVTIWDLRPRPMFRASAGSSRWAWLQLRSSH